MKWILTTAALLIALSGCGGSSSEGGSDDASSSLPACGDIWVEGETLPDDYDGCLNGDTIEAAVLYECGDGGQATSYNDELGARLGGTIVAATEQLPDC